MIVIYDLRLLRNESKLGKVDFLSNEKYYFCGSSQFTSPKYPVSCIEPGLEISFFYDMTQKDGTGREVGGGFRMGNTCTPVTDSC